MPADRLFKVLDVHGRSCHGGFLQWSLPVGDKPGAWMPPIQGALVPCERGYHLCRDADLVRWLGPTIYLAEAHGERLDCEDKVVVREARLLRQVDTWTEQSARLFACDCAEGVLAYAGTLRAVCEQTIATARRYATGNATARELCAAESAAGNAAGSAAWNAAWARQSDLLVSRLFPLGEEVPDAR